MHLNITLKLMSVTLLSGLFFLSPLLATYQEEDRQEQALRVAIHRGLNLTVDQAMNTYVLLNKKIISGQIIESTFKNLRDTIKAPEALITGKILSPKTTTLEKLIDNLNNHSMDILEDSDLKQALITLKGSYKSYYENLKIFTNDKLIQLREYKHRLSLEGEPNFYRINCSMDLLNLSNQEIAAHSFCEHEGVFYKAHEGSKAPLSPGKEYAVYALYRLLGIEIPATCLMSVDSDEDLVKGHWPHRVIQACSKVEGKGFDYILETGIPFIANYTKQFIGALLSLPEDGKANNYIYNPESRLLIPIDNDLSFVPAVHFQEDSSFLRHKSILFCLKDYLNQPLDQNYVDFLQTIHPEVLLLSWLGHLHQKNESYHRLFSLNQSLERFEDLRGWNGRDSKRDYLETCRIKWQKIEQGIEYQLEHDRRYLSKEDFQEMELPIRLSWNQVNHLYQSLKILKKSLRDNATLTHAQLLECCMPLSAVLYQHINKQAQNPLEIYELIDVTSLSTLVHQISYNKSVKVWLEKEAQEIVELLSPKILAERFLKAYLNPYEVDVDLAVLEVSALYFKEALVGTFTQGLPEGYLEQLIAEKAPYTLLKLLFESQNNFPDQGKSLLNQAFYLDHDEAIQALIEHGIKSFDTEPALIYWKGLMSHNRLNALRHFESLIPYSSELQWKLTLESIFPGVLQSEERFISDISVVKGTQLGKRCLSQELINRLFDQKGYFKRQSTFGRSAINWWPEKNPQIYFKQRPELPGYEYAATSFMRRLGIEGAPYSELMAFYNAEEGFYPVLVTQAIEGDIVKQVWGDDTVFNNLDSYHTQLMILATMLINAEDGKEDNYILTPDHTRLISIDNDHAFIPGSTQVQEKSWIRTTVSEKLQSKSLLFCLKEMKWPFDEKIRHLLKDLNIDEFLKEWLKDLVKVNDRYQGFFPEPAKYFNHNYPTILRIPLSSVFLESLYRKMHTLKGLIMDNPQINPLQILVQLEPYVGKQYARAFEDTKLKTVKERFLGVTRGLFKSNKSGDRLSVLNSREMMQIISIPDQELIGETHKITTGPLAALETLEDLQEEQKALDKVCDQLLNPTSFSPSFQSLKGTVNIDLKEKSSREQNLLLSKLLQGNTPTHVLSIYHSIALSDDYLRVPLVQEKLRLLRCLDLRGCTSLMDSSFQLIYMSSPMLEYLNISGWPKLNKLKSPKQQVHFSLKRLIAQDCLNLESINLLVPVLRVLEVSNNKALKTLNVSSQALEFINIEDDSFLEVEEFKDILQRHPSLIKLNVKSTNINLFELGLRYAEGRDVVQDDTEALKYYKLAAEQGHKIATCIVENILSSPVQCLDLIEKGIGDREIRALLSINLLTLLSLNLRNNNIADKGVETLVKGNLINLTSLNLSSNNVGDKGAEALAKGNLDNLTSLYLWRNKIGDKGTEAIAQGNLTKLTALDLRRNKIGYKGTEALAQGNLTNLTSLDLWSNNIGDKGAEALAQGNLTNLTSLYLEGNKIGDKGAETFAQGKLTKLIDLNLMGNKITDKGAEALAQGNLTKLTTLNLMGNKITDKGAAALAQGNLTNLTSLDLKGNNIEEKDNRAH